jgi:hypothetical protein
MQANVENIREEHFYAARGEYMRLVEGAQHARDDEHTEVSIYLLVFRIHKLRY